VVSENELEQPSSPSVKKTEEKGVVVVHEVKCKLYVKVFFYFILLYVTIILGKHFLFPCFNSAWSCFVHFNNFVYCYVQSSDPADKDAWKDKGMGQLSIKCKEGVSKATKESKPTIVVRNEVCSCYLFFIAMLIY